MYQTTSPAPDNIGTLELDEEIADQKDHAPKG